MCVAGAFFRMQEQSGRSTHSLVSAADDDVPSDDEPTSATDDGVPSNDEPISATGDDSLSCNTEPLLASPPGDSRTK